MNARCPLNPDEIMKALEMCLCSTLFTFRELLYHQTEGIGMGLPVSQLVANLFIMDSLEANAIMRCPTPPKMWLRYVDDTFVIIRLFLHMNFRLFLPRDNLSIQWILEKFKSWRFRGQHKPLKFLKMDLIPQVIAPTSLTVPLEAFLTT
ncbi:unnamed protein product [Trichobilharzia regenti]|nr:unnamed protein product [Trichobilharzia regenti]